jgi:hypothetical protein
MREEGKYPIPDNLPEGSKIYYPEAGGMIIKGPNGRGNLPGTVVPNRISTGEESRARNQIRAEKTRQRTREWIEEMAGEKFDEFLKTGKFKKPVGKDSVEIFAATAALLFNDIVLNDKAYPRDRLAAYDKLGKQAEVLNDVAEQQAVNLPQKLLDDAKRILLVIEYEKAVEKGEIVPNITPLRNAEVIDVQPENVINTPEKKSWV